MYNVLTCCKVAYVPYSYILQFGLILLEVHGFGLVELREEVEILH